MSHLRWGLLGAGHIARNFARNLQDAGFEVTTVGSRSRAKADTFARELGLATAHGSYEELVADPDVDVIYVATPNSFHEQHALLALEAGKHVLVEKPLALNADQARRIFAAAESRGLVAMEAMWMRYLPPLARIRQILAAGTIGRVTAVIADHSQDLADDPDYRLNAPELGGGTLLDLGVYPVSFALDILGEVSTVTAVGVLKPTGVDGQVAVILRSPDDALALISSASISPGANTAVIVGTEGRIELARTFYHQTPFVVTSSTGEVLERWEPSAQHHGFEFEAAELERLVAEGISEPPVLTHAASIRVMEIMDEVRRQVGVVFPGEG